jgi:hypothetical protein
MSSQLPALNYAWRRISSITSRGGSILSWRTGPRPKRVLAKLLLYLQATMPGWSATNQLSQLTGSARPSGGGRHSADRSSIQPSVRDLW